MDSWNQVKIPESVSAQNVKDRTLFIIFKQYDFLAKIDFIYAV